EASVNRSVEGDSLQLGDALIKLGHVVFEVLDANAQCIQLFLELVDESAKLIEVRLGGERRMLLLHLCEQAGYDHGYLITGRRTVTFESAVRITLEDALRSQRGYGVLRPH